MKKVFLLRLLQEIAFLSKKYLSAKEISKGDFLKCSLSIFISITKLIVKLFQIKYSIRNKEIKKIINEKESPELKKHQKDKNKQYLVYTYLKLDNDN